jgi:prepilin-type N-terminal cleavage/methylation domain-containing protein
MYRKGFTLAEVLITLSIIGVVAALTIPSIVHNVEKAQLRNAFKSFYSTFSQAHKLVAAEHGGSIKGVFTPNQWDLIDDDNGDGKRDDYAAYLKWTKVCDDATVQGCWHAASAWKYINGDDGAALNQPGFVLNNGMLLVLYTHSLSTCTLYSLNDGCIIFFVDVNGFKGPNVMGRDIFAITVRESDVMPTGRPGEIDDVATNVARGWGSAYKVIMNEDY